MNKIRRAYRGHAIKDKDEKHHPILDLIFLVVIVALGTLFMFALSPPPTP